MTHLKTKTPVHPDLARQLYEERDAALARVAALESVITQAVDVLRSGASSESKRAWSMLEAALLPSLSTTSQAPPTCDYCHATFDNEVKLALHVFGQCPVDRHEAPRPSDPLQEPACSCESPSLRGYRCANCYLPMRERTNEAEHAIDRRVASKTPAGRPMQARANDVPLGYRTPDLNPGVRVRIKGTFMGPCFVDGWVGPKRVRIRYGGATSEVDADQLEVVDDEPSPDKAPPADECRSPYFCRRRPGHRGPHRRTPDEPSSLPDRRRLKLIAADGGEASQAEVEALAAALLETPQRSETPEVSPDAYERSGSLGSDQ